MNARTMLVLFALVASGLGQWRWQYIYNGPQNLYDAARCVVYGLDGNLYAAGTTHPATPPVTTSPSSA